MSSRCSHNMVNFGTLTAEIGSGAWGTPANFNGFRVLTALLARQSSSERQRNFAALNRGRHLCSAGRPSRWALAHILVLLFFILHPMYTTWTYPHSLPCRYCYCTADEAALTAVNVCRMWQLLRSRDTWDEQTRWVGVKRDDHRRLRRYIRLINDNRHVLWPSTANKNQTRISPPCNLLLVYFNSSYCSW